MSEKYPSYDVFAILSNEIRRDVLEHIRLNKFATFAELITACGLDMLWDCGTLGYHVNHLVDEMVLEKSEKGYILTDFGKNVANLLANMQKEISDILKGKGGELVLENNETSGIRVRRE